MEILSPWKNYCIISNKLYHKKGRACKDFLNRFYNRNILKQFRVRIDHGGLVNSRVRCCVPSYWYIHLMNHSTSINLSPNTYTYDFMMTSHNNMNCFLVTLNIFLPKLKNYCGKEECITVNMFFRFCLARKCTFFLAIHHIFF